MSQSSKIKQKDSGQKRLKGEKRNFLLFPGAVPSGQAGEACAKVVGARWAGEIDALKKRRFTTLDEIRGAVIDRILARTGGGWTSESEEREFLSTLLSHAPESDLVLRELLCATENQDE